MKTTNLVMMIAGMFAGALSGTAAQADGFTCQGRSTGINIKVFNHTDPNAGTRVAAVMVLSNPNIQSPNKTIAKFTSQNATLAYKGNGVWKAKVDLRYSDTSRKGELIGGTKLGQLSAVDLDLAFNYSSYETQLAQATQTNGVIRYFKRNGDYNVESVTCKRYLKSSI
jgi:hypothetical protein